MKQIYFATKNKGKVATVGKELAEHGIELVQAPLDLPEPRTDDLERIAGEKVRFAFEKIRKPCIALDSGFYVHSLNGFPKAFVNFALETIGVEGILRLTEGKPRDCAFRNCLAYLDDSLPKPLFFESAVNGTLSEKRKGTQKDYFWSDLFFVFVPEGEDKTLAEMTPEEYYAYLKGRRVDSMSHNFGKWFSARA
ncbi:MAG: non-canonical purine NTP pyrophosphatase [Candidatus Micrarchaeia archaeon]